MTNINIGEMKIDFYICNFIDMSSKQNAKNGGKIAAKGAKITKNSDKNAKNSDIADKDAKIIDKSANDVNIAGKNAKINSKQSKVLDHHVDTKLKVPVYKHHVDEPQPEPSPEPKSKVKGYKSQSGGADVDSYAKVKALKFNYTDLGFAYDHNLMLRNIHYIREMINENVDVYKLDTYEEHNLIANVLYDLLGVCKAIDILTLDIAAKDISKYVNALLNEFESKYESIIGENVDINVYINVAINICINYIYKCD